MEFMIGMYEVERSGDTERMRIRGSGRAAALAGELGAGWVIRLMSVLHEIKDGETDGNCAQHSDFVSAPTNAHGSVNANKRGR